MSHWLSWLAWFLPKPSKLVIVAAAARNVPVATKFVAALSACVIVTMVAASKPLAVNNLHAAQHLLQLAVDAVKFHHAVDAAKSQPAADAAHVEPFPAVAAHVELFLADAAHAVQHLLLAAHAEQQSLLLLLQWKKHQLHQLTLQHQLPNNFSNRLTQLSREKFKNDTKASPCYSGEVFC